MKSLSLLLTFLAISILVVGCAEDKTAKKEPAKAAEKHSDDDGHDHSHDEGAHDHTPPHGGQLIELGRGHEYHAEMVDDHKTESMTIYLMDSHMEALSIKETSVTLVLTAGDDTQTFELLASQPGGSDEFASNDENLMEMIEKEGVKGKLRVNIDGKPFSGSFDHHDHDHDHGDDDDHKDHDH